MIYLNVILPTIVVVDVVVIVIIAYRMKRLYEKTAYDIAKIDARMRRHFFKPLPRGISRD